ncbi:hypothetical protein CHU95_17055 [Niveispirillum lacus]|uniref:von Hippel-Lindau disease tumour suppressor beta domain-containing protein n=1 Tax=Niveispirillum lacus TaxID=1981099 RepID=A0A255YTF6_9PROT|nr:hypothetical protein [Niveispirillum lacus]OYQ32498.1 hypothetical protein CHU95_17055 [Niveispirillum lacus]
MRGFFVACAMAISVIAASSAHAQQCDNQQQPSPQTRTKAGMSLQNATTSQINVLWADFEGVLTHYTTLQPKQTAAFDSYVGHIWYLEAFTPEGAVCLGPIRPAQVNTTCKMRIELDSQGFLYEQQACKVE